MSTPRDAIAVTQAAEVWQLTRNWQTLAVIERAWDDHHWLLFLADGHGELVCQGAVGRIASRKTCLTMWARRNSGTIAPFLDSGEQPE